MAAVEPSPGRFATPQRAALDRADAIAGSLQVLGGLDLRGWVPRRRSFGRYGVRDYLNFSPPRRSIRGPGSLRAVSPRRGSCVTRSAADPGAGAADGVVRARTAALTARCPDL